jgi:uncharacterized peroxidase-related enzyme
MSYVSQIAEEQAGPQLKALFQQIREAMGFIPNYFQAVGQMPEVLEAQLALGKAILKDGALPKKIKEQIGLVVSGLNTSSYCVAFHMEVLRGLGVEKTLSRKLTTDYPNAPVTAEVQALFHFADKLTRKPGDIAPEDAEAVRKAGWDENALLETVLTVAYFGFVNRVSLGLGLMADY